MARLKMRQTGIASTRGLSTITENSSSKSICPICENNPVELTDSGRLRICWECVEARQKENIYNSRIRNIRETLKKAGVPEKFLSAQLKRAEKENIGKGLFLQGPAGLGKTYMACAYLREYALLGKSIRFVISPDLFLSIRGEAFDGSMSEEQVINRWKKTQVLVLDDLGTEKSSEWVDQTLYTIIDYRYREMMITIITSNLLKNVLEKKIDKRLVSRFHEMCTTITLKGYDRRVKK